MEGTPQEVVNHLENRINEAAKVINVHTTVIDELTAAVNEINEGNRKRSELIKKAIEDQIRPYKQAIAELQSFMNTSIADATKAMQILDKTKSIPGTNMERGEVDNNSEFERGKIWRKSDKTLRLDHSDFQYKIKRDHFNEITENYYTLNQANEIIDMLNKKEQ